MRGVFDEEEQRPAHQRRDRELTLGSGTLLAIFFGLVLICGVCFGLGYSVGIGPQVETDYYNFESMNFPPGHPASLRRLTHGNHPRFPGFL